jgi:O-antigen/teichoic acid export membrane protein
MTSVKQLAAKGTLWTIIGYGGSQILRFAGSLILTRLLFPELFGLMGIVNIFIAGLQLFSDVGIGLNIIQNKRGDEPEFYNTAWTIQVVRGFGLWLMCLIITIPIASLYEQPELKILIPVTGFSTILGGFTSTAIFSLERHLKVREQIAFEMVTQAIGITVMVVWSLINPSVWALSVGGLVAGFFKMIWSHQLIPTIKNRFLWDKLAVQEILLIGRWVFLSTAVMFTAEQADRLMLAKLVPLAFLGVYQLTLNLSELPRQIAIALSMKVIFPSISKIIDQPKDIVIEKIIKSRRWFLISFMLLMASMISMGDLIIKILYDQRYSDGSWMLPILSIGLWPRLLAHTSEPYLFAIGRVHYITYGNISRLLFTIIGITVGFYYFQVPGAVIGVALNDLSYYFVVTYGLSKEGLNVLPQDIGITFVLIIIVLAVYVFRGFLGISPSFFQYLS